MEISSAVFDRSAPDLASCPDESLPEFAFIGRSNVGKSSLLNMLAGRDRLARVSPRPGFTRLINFFTMNRTWRLVDLPGYGFAEGARKDRKIFNRAVGDYLAHRPSLACVFALIDSGLTPQAIDLEFIAWLTERQLPFVLVFTKTDRGTPESVRANVQAFKDAVAGWYQQMPESFECSAETGQGRAALLKMIGETLAAVLVEEKPAPSEPTVKRVTETEPPFELRIRANRISDVPGHGKKKSKSPRPW
ncbi:MAG: ribosome biogenesis GTP-binding protein YihA/YsxC [Verrucomicrobiota bacterium]